MAVLPALDTNVHVPVAIPGLFPLNVAVDVLQIVWSTPASAKGGNSFMVTVTLLELAVQLPLVIVHLKT
ncbi:hypothetical protein D3C85_1520420 [compost metagenome]